MAPHTCSTESGASLWSGGVCPAHEPLQEKETLTLLLNCNVESLWSLHGVLTAVFNIAFSVLFKQCSTEDPLNLQRHTNTRDKDQLLRACQGKKRTTLSRTAQFGVHGPDTLSRGQRPKYSLS